MPLPDITTGKTMQIATVQDGRPWICTVYYVLHGGSFYWLSFPSRRHSQDIARDQNVAIAIVLKPTKPVIGIQAEGVAAVITDTAEMTAVLERYVAKYGQGKDFVTRFLAGENQHNLYKMTPGRVMLFDEYTSRKMPHRDITKQFLDNYVESVE